VLAGDRVVQAVGTAFNIEIKPGREIELVVIEGSVRVGEQSTLVNMEQNNVQIVLPRSAEVVTAGQELVMGKEAKQARPINDAEIQVKLSWQKGNLIFRGEPLADVVKEVERYTGVEFVFLNENLKEAHVSGFFKAGDVEGMLAVLKENFSIEFQRESENRVLLYGI
jgi:transmembrane sensor